MATEEKSGSPVIPVQQGEISGVWVNLYPIPKDFGEGFGVDRRGVRLLMRRKLGGKLGIKARQRRAAISSYGAEDWVYHGANGVLFGISSLDSRMLDHVDRRDKSRQENGLRGGRRPLWDVTPSSGIKQRQVIETQVAPEPREPFGLEKRG